MDQKIALNVGCGPSQKKDTHYLIQGDEWKHIRVDIDPSVAPDVVDNIITLDKFEDNSVDAIFSSHNLEHLHEFDARRALRTFYNRLKEGGLCIIIVPNFKAACEMIANGKIDPVYVSPAGPIRAIDMVFGYTPFTHNNHHQRHLFGYTVESLQTAMHDAGFKGLQVGPDNHYNIWAFGQKYS